jgi:hypothetical protein
LDEVKRPPSLPAGLYYGSVTAYEWTESRFENRETKEKDAVCRYALRISHAGPDVEAGRLEGIDLAKRRLSRDMPVSGGNEWVTKTFLEGLGIATAGRTFAECCPEAVNAQVMFEITERPNEKDPEAPAYNDVRALRAAA